MRAVLALLLLSYGTYPALAQQAQCGPTDAIRKELAKKWREVETTVGLMTGGQSYMSIFVSPNGETWTAIVGNVNGTSCIVASGSLWMQGEVPAGDPV